MERSLEHKVVVVVEEATASRAATEWAANNFLRPRDVVTLLYVAPPTRSRKKRRTLRLKGFQLALSFHELCSSIPEIKLEIVVKEGDQLEVIQSVVKEIDAETLVVGLHDNSCLYE